MPRCDAMARGSIAARRTPRGGARRAVAQGKHKGLAVGERRVARIRWCAPPAAGASLRRARRPGRSGTSVSSVPLPTTLARMPPASPHLRRNLSLRDLVVFGLLFIGPLAPVGVFGVLDARGRSSWRRRSWLPR